MMFGAKYQGFKLTSFKLSQFAKTTFLLCTTLLSYQSLAVTCNAVFPDVAASHSSGTLRFDTSARLYDTDGLLSVRNITNNYSSSCDTQSCAVSGSLTDRLSIPSFNHTNSSQDLRGPANGNYYMYQGSYDILKLEQNVTLEIRQNNQQTRLSALIAYDNVTIRLDSGVYWIDSLTMGANSRIEVDSGEKAVVYVQSVSFGQNIKFNTTGDVDQLVIIAYGDFGFSINSNMSGFLYAQGDVSFGQNSGFTGAFNATNITLGENGKYYTQVADLQTADFNGMCEQNVMLPDPIAYYPMDLCTLPSGTGSIDDEIGSNDGDALGSIGLNYSAKYCQAAVLSGERSYINLPDPASSDLSQGSISLYFNTSDLTHSNYPSAGAMALVSRDANGTQSGGHLTIWVTDSGAISVRQQDSRYSYNTNTSSYIVQENQWHHLVYTWGSDGMRIYVDGTLRNSPRAYYGGLSANGIDMAIGANAWGYRPSSSTSRVNQLKDFFIGSIDEVRIYDEQLSASQISSLQQITAQDCLSCSSDPVEVAHWGADVCSFEQNQIVDVVSGINAIARNGISNEYSSRFCQGLAFDGNQSYATVDHDSRLQVSDGAFSLWVKISDLSHSNNEYAGGNALLSKDSINYSNGGHLELRVDANGYMRVRHQTTSATNRLRSAQQVIFENQWHHVVYSFGATGAYIYVDGQEVASDTGYFNGLATNDETLVFGASARRAARGSTSASNYRDFFLGEMDHIKLYRNQPSYADVQSWYSEQAVNCNTCSSLVAEYTFDQSSSDSLVIEDSSGNGNDGVINAALNTVLLDDNISCRALETYANFNSSSISFDTGVDANDLGSQGGITFWYQSKTDWDDGTDRQLFDATELDSSGSNLSKYFYLSKTGDGEISFGLEDTNDDEILIKTSPFSFTADEWVHIGVQWNLVSREFRLYINGQESSVGTYYEAQLGSLGALGSIIFGDNKVNYTVFDSTKNSANAYFDDIRMYSQSISQAQVQEDMDAAESCAIVHHYLIEHPAQALTCDSPQVIVKACIDETCSQLSTLPSTIEFTPDQYLPASNVNFTGQKTLEVNQTSAGTFSIVSSIQDPVAPIECSNNCEIEFESAGIQFFNRATGATNFANARFVAEQTLESIGVRIVGSNGGTCEGLVNGQQSIDLSYECVATTNVDYTPSICNVPFAGIALSGGASQSGNISLSFDVNGETDLSAYSFADVGILRLNASATINGTAVQASSTDLYMVPASLQLSTTSNSVNVAGENFGLNVQALGQEGSVLPGYQANKLQASALRVAPVSANAADSQFFFDANNQVSTSPSTIFADISPNFAAGQASTSTAYLEEVGAYTLQLQDADYLSTVISSNTVDLGRFTPAYFDVQSVHQPLLENAHTNFTYIGQTFGYATGLAPKLTVKAYNALGQVTQNYADSLWQLSPNLSTVQGSLSTNDSSTYSGTLTRITTPNSLVITGTDTFDGQAEFSIEGGEFAYQKIVSPSGTDASPFAGSIDLSFGQAWFTDADGICYQANYPSGCSSFSISNVSGNTLKYGRLNIENAFGPEIAPVSVNVISEYLDQGQWRINTQDSATTLTLLQSSGNIQVTHDQQSVNNLVALLPSLSINSALLNGQLPNTALSIGPLMSAGNPMTGSFYLELVPSSTSGHWSQYLNYDWDGDGDIDEQDMPSASITLGIYKGSERTLHWREVLN